MVRSDPLHKFDHYTAPDHRCCPLKAWERNVVFRIEQTPVEALRIALHWAGGYSSCSQVFETAACRHSASPADCLLAPSRAVRVHRQHRSLHFYRDRAIDVRAEDARSHRAKPRQCFGIGQTTALSSHYSYFG